MDGKLFYKVIQRVKSATKVKVLLVLAVATLHFAIVRDVKG